MAEEWTNWSGSVRFEPAEINKPGQEEEVRQLVSQALAQKREIRVVGAGHSSSPLVKTNQILVDLGALKGLVSHQPETGEVKILPATSVQETGQELIKLGLAMHNTGDVDYQTLAGAFSTGTHGSGRSMQNLPGMLVGCRLVDGRGQVQAFTREQHPEMLQAARVALGALGILTELTIQTEPARQFVRKEYCTHIDTCLHHLPALIADNQMFDFYWYPRSDLAKLRTCNPAEAGVPPLPFADQVKEQAGWLYQILPRQRTLKYEEMEYALPFEAGPACFREVRDRIKARHRQYVGWRVLYRTVAADDAYLSPFSQRDSVTIAVLQNHQLEYQKYFDDIEPIFKAYGGRPHWGKKHSLTAKELNSLYPDWEKFLQIRKELDPEGIFPNNYLREILGI